MCLGNGLGWSMDLLAEEMSISGQYLSFCRNAHSVCLSQGNMSVQLYKILWLCLVVKLIGITIIHSKRLYFVDFTA